MTAHNDPPYTCSPFRFWQFWRNSEDADVGRFLRLFTEVPMDEIAKLETLQGKNINDAKKILANLVTAMLHGPEAAAAAEKQAEALFAGAAPAADALDVPLAKLSEGLSFIEALRLANLAESNSAARKLIQQGGARINDVQVKDITAKLSSEHLREGLIKLSAGKKHHRVLRFT